MELEVVMGKVEVAVVEDGWNSNEGKSALRDALIEHWIKSGWSGFISVGRVNSKTLELIDVVDDMDASEVSRKSESVGIDCV